MEKHFRDVVKSRLRHPGGLHEWLPVERADLIKKWGVAYDDYARLRTPLAEVAFTDPDAVHGGPGSARAHRELVALMGASKNLAAYRKRLNRWADHRLAGGRDALPEPLRSPSERKVSRERAVPKLPRTGHVIAWLAEELPAATLDAYLAETTDGEDDSRPPSRLAADFALPWVDHDFLETRRVETPIGVESLLAPFSFAPSFADLVAEEMAEKMGDTVEAGAAVLLYDSPYPPTESPPAGAPLRLLGVFETDRRTG